MPSLVWLRRDLRVVDHVALAEATRSNSPVAVVFVFDTTILDRLEDRDDRRVTFFVDSLIEVDAALRGFGSRLIVRVGNPVSEIVQVARDLRVDAVFANRDYEPEAKERDQHVATALASIGAEFHLSRDQVIFDGDDVVTAVGKPFRVFTPYRRAWDSRLNLSDTPVPPDVEHVPNLHNLVPEERTERLCHDWSFDALGFRRASGTIEAGSANARRTLERFLPRLPSYRDERNYPSINGTSGLSVHLRFGTIAVREVVRAARAVRGDGAETFLGEIAWRDFFQMILDQFPHVVSHAFRAEFDHIEWPGSDEHFRLWSAGATGYPIVDAAMRELNSTGSMHNRLRMVVASFLVKDLLVDWRRGESYFARRLLDYDLAANNGNWQWAASTGVDAQPWFRIFNPTTQSRRFDPDGTYIRRYCPELSGFSKQAIHAPWESTPIEQGAASCIIGNDYPAPIVDHARQRERALALYKRAASKA